MQTLRELERDLNVSRDTLLRWIKTGKLSAVRLPGGHFRVEEDAARKLVRSGEREGGQ